MKRRPSQITFGLIAALMLNALTACAAPAQTVGSSPLNSATPGLTELASIQTGPGGETTPIVAAKDEKSLILEEGNGIYIELSGSYDKPTIYFAGPELFKRLNVLPKKIDQSPAPDSGRYEGKAIFDREKERVHLRFGFPKTDVKVDLKNKQIVEGEAGEIPQAELIKMAEYFQTLMDENRDRLKA